MKIVGKTSSIILEKLMKNWIELVYLFGGCYLVAIPQLQFHCPFFQACHFGNGNSPIDR